MYVTYGITILERSLTMIDMNLTPKRLYVKGEAFTVLTDNPGGANVSGSIWLHFNNGESEVRLLSSATIGNPANTFNIDNSRFDNGNFYGNSQLRHYHARQAVRRD
jgi:hypothetical protein